MLQRGEERERKEEERKEKERRARRARREKRKRGEREEKEEGRKHTHARRTRHTHTSTKHRQKERPKDEREGGRRGPGLVGPCNLSARFGRHAGAFCSPRVQTADEPTQRLTCKSKLAVRPDHSHLFRLQLRKLATVTAASVNTHSRSTRHGVVTGMLPFKGSEARNCAAAPVVRALSQSLCHAVKARGVEVV